MVNTSSLVSCKGSRAVINLSKDVISQLMQDSLYLYCHQKGQSCIPLWSWLCFPVCYLHCSNTNDAIWRGKPWIWSGGELILLLQKINRVQLDKVPEIESCCCCCRAAAGTRKAEEMGRQEQPIEIPVDPSCVSVCSCTTAVSPCCWNCLVTALRVSQWRWSCDHTW